MVGVPLLFCEDEGGLREVLGMVLKRAGFDPRPVTNLRDALAALESWPECRLILTDLNLPDGSGMQLLEEARSRSQATQVIVLTAHANTDQVVRAMRNGAYDYLKKPFANDELIATLHKAAEKARLIDENQTLRRYLEGVDDVGGLRARDPAMKRVVDVIRRVAQTQVSVLVTGESGTGKEVVARAIHDCGPRAKSPFIVVNCGALPENLMESELFGHEKGAFSGADQAKAGLFRAAQGGTLFLDEVGELPPPLQVKLLRVLQERRVRAVGAAAEVAIDVRVLAATNRDLERAVAAGEFRQDLFYRLNVVRLSLPPLRERRDDILMLARFFLEKHGALQGRRALTLSTDALNFLHEHDFPGNVRELENLIERAVALAPGPAIEPADFLEPAALTSPGFSIEALATPSLPEKGLSLEMATQRFEVDLIRQALERAEGNRTQAAKLLGLTFRSLRYRLTKYGLAEDSGDNPLGSGS